MREHVNMMITNACNMHCRHCYLDCGAKGVFPDTSYILETARGFKENGILRITLTGGECTIHPGIRDIIIGIKNLGMGVNIFTNCLKASSDIIDQIDGIFISLDGPENHHDMVRCHQGAYAGVMRVLKYCSEKNRQVSIQTTIVPGRIDCLDHISEVCGRFPGTIKTIHVAAVAHIGRGAENFDHLDGFLEDVESATIRLQRQVGFKTKVVNNIYYSPFSKAFYNDKMSYSLWADMCKGECYHIDGFDNIPLNHYSQEWDRKMNARISDSMMALNLPTLYVIDEAYAQISCPYHD